MATFLESLQTMIIEDIVALSKDPEAAKNSVRVVLDQEQMTATQIFSGKKEIPIDLGNVSGTVVKNWVKVEAPDVEEFTKMLSTVWSLGKEFMGKK